MTNHGLTTHLFALRRRKMLFSRWHRDSLARRFPMIAITCRTPNGIRHFGQFTPVHSDPMALLWRSSSKRSRRLAGVLSPVHCSQFFPDDRHNSEAWYQTLEIPWPMPTICRLMAIIGKDQTHVMVIIRTLEHHPSCGVSFPLNTIRHQISPFWTDRLHPGCPHLTSMPLWRPSGDAQSILRSTASCGTGLGSPQIRANQTHRDFPDDRHKSRSCGPTSSRRSHPTSLWRAFGKIPASYGERLEKKLQFPYQSQKNSS